MRLSLTNSTAILQIRSLARTWRVPFTKVIYIAVGRLYKDYQEGRVTWEERQ